MLERGGAQAGAGLTPRQRLRRRAADALVGQGLREVVGWSFNGPELRERLRLGPEVPEIELENPMSSEQSRMRTTLLGSLLDIAARNHSHGASRLRFFQTGAVFLPLEGEPLPREPYHVGGVLAGPVRPPSWREPTPGVADFFAVKGMVAGLLHALDARFEIEQASHPFLHPGRQAAIVVAGRAAGWLGEVHPLVAVDWDLDVTIAAFELDLDAVPEAAPGRYEDLVSFPAVREDLAVVVGDDVTAARVRETIIRAGAPLLHSAEVFDVYRDETRIGAGKVSLAVSLVFRAPDRTLTDEEVARKRQTIIEALEHELEGRVRAA
jgi:phenylalanyl-tRNA synthetase beta chain